MTQNEIIEGNKLIAEFMGFEKYPIKGKSDGHMVIFNKGFVPKPTCSANLEFHSSWDWLMFCIFEIQDLPDVYHWELSAGNFEINADETFETLDNSIEGVWEIVVKFIKWYNIRKI